MAKSKVTHSASLRVILSKRRVKRGARRRMKNIAVFASGRGSNFAAIVKEAKAGKIKANLALLVSDNPQAGALSLAKKAKIKAVVVERKNFYSKKEFEKKIIEHLRENKINLIILAGFMRILSPFFVSCYRNRILNIHPSLLPFFKGAHAIKDAFSSGGKVTGVTVHFVDEEIDHGAIILQEAVPVYPKDSLEKLEARIHKVEHRVYPEAIRIALPLITNIPD